jgi:hypothetical protein
MTITYSRLYSRQYHWNTVDGSITSSQAALGNDKSTTIVDAIADANKLTFSLDDGWAAIEIRFRGGANNEANILNLYAKKDSDDHYTPIAVLTLRTGQQTDGTYNFIDTINVSSKSWPDGGMEALSLADDAIARLDMNTYGYKDFLLIATALGSSEIFADVVRI